jgi:hypothetical protein
MEEYGYMLRVVADRETAREAARVNLSAILAGQPRIVEREARYATSPLREAISRNRDDLIAIRSAVAAINEKVMPKERARPLRARDMGPER